RKLMPRSGGRKHNRAEYNDQKGSSQYQSVLVADEIFYNRQIDQDSDRISESRGHDGAFRLEPLNQRNIKTQLYKQTGQQAQNGPALLIDSLKNGGGYGK